MFSVSIYPYSEKKNVASLHLCNREEKIVKLSGLIPRLTIMTTVLGKNGEAVWSGMWKCLKPVYSKYTSRNVLKKMLWVCVCVHELEKISVPKKLAPLLWQLVLQLLLKLSTSAFETTYLSIGVCVCVSVWNMQMTKRHHVR